MDAAKSIVTIVNKNYPPRPGITGESANELAKYLQENGFLVKIVHTDATYSGEANFTVPTGKLIAVKGLYDGKNKIIRLFAGFIESYRLVNKARKQPGLVIVMTDPPFLLFWSAILLKRKRWAYWSMDLYPEAFEAANLISSKNVLYKWYKEIVYKVPPSFLIALGGEQSNFVKSQYKKELLSVVLPCGICALESSRGLDESPVWRADNNKIYFGYCGNLGEAHSEEFLLEVMAALDRLKHVMILAIYGAKAERVLQAAKGSPSVIVVKSVPRQDLRWIDIHLVTLLPQWDHVCVPSKAVSAVCMGGPILFCGSDQNDNWIYLKNAGWLVNGINDIKQQVQHFLKEITPELIASKRKAAIALSQELNDLKKDSFKKIAELARI